MSDVKKPGWYPVTVSGTSRFRWWDGIQWTEAVSDSLWAPAPRSPRPYVQPKSAPPSAPWTPPTSDPPTAAVGEPAEPAGPRHAAFRLPKLPKLRAEPRHENVEPGAIRRRVVVGGIAVALVVLVGAIGTAVVLPRGGGDAPDLRADQGAGGANAEPKPGTPSLAPTSPPRPSVTPTRSGRPSPTAKKSAKKPERTSRSKSPRNPKRPVPNPPRKPVPEPAPKPEPEPTRKPKVPAMPAEAREQSPAGAGAFVVYYVKLVDYGLRTRDFGPARNLMQDCGTPSCEAFTSADPAVNPYLGKRMGTYSVWALVLPSDTSVDSKLQILDDGKSIAEPHGFKLKPTGDSWRVTSIDP